MTGLGSMDGNNNNNNKWSFLFFAFIFLIIYSSSCSSPQQSYKDKLPDGLKVVSVYGEKDFDKSNMRVDLQGWRADAPQSLFLAEPEKNRTYLLAYVLPPELVREVWGDSANSLSHFVGLNYANIDERTTALWLVMNAPGYFWLFTPRALVYAAKFVVEHPKFEELVSKISETKPGEILSGNYPEVFGLAAQIAEDVREKIFPADETKKAARFFPKDGTFYTEVPCDISDQGIAKFQDAPGLGVKFTVQHMIFYGVGMIEGFDPGRLDKIRRYAVLNAQKAKVDLSLGNILTLNFINPTIDTQITLPGSTTYAIRVEKGFELSWSIFTDPIKRIGLASNFGRIVKYVIEVAVPNIASCIPDGDAWGWAVATAQNILDTGSIDGMSQLIGRSWDEIVRVLVSHFVNQNSFIYRILNRVGFASCAYNGEFIISTIASALGGYPIIVLYNAFTKYIPFGWELFTRPKTGVFYAVEGIPLPSGIPLVREIYPLPASSPGIIKLKSVGPECTSCRLRVVCQSVGGILDQGIYLTCQSEYPIYIPPNLDDTCDVLIVKQESTQQCPPIIGCPFGLFAKNNYYEIILSKWTVKVNRCDECINAGFPGSATEYYQKKKESEEGGGCSTTPPQSPYHIFAIFVIFVLKELRKAYRFRK
jgi:hypothetical protein